MNKELISEINRFREIAGLSLLNEGPGGPGKWFVTGSDEVSETLSKTSDDFKNGLDDLSSISSKTVDEINDPFLKEFKRSIDEVAATQGKTFDDVVANPKFREMAEKKFALSVKKNVDLINKYTEAFYKKNVGAQQLVDKKLLSKTVSDAVENKGVTDYEQLKNLFNKRIDDFRTKEGNLPIPEIVKAEMKKIIDSEIDNLTGGGVIEKSIDDMLKKNSEKIMNSAEQALKKEGKILPNPKKLTDDVIDKLKQNQSSEDIIKYLSKEFGVLESEYKNGFQKFMSRYVGAPISGSWKWVFNQGKNVIQFYAKGKTGKKIVITILVPTISYLLYEAYNYIKESDEPESLKLWKDNYSGFDGYPKEVQDWISNTYAYTTYRNPKNAKDNPSLFIKSVSYRKDQPDLTFPATHYITIVFGDGKKVETESEDMIFWTDVPKTPEQIKAEEEAAKAAEAAKGSTTVTAITDDEKNKVLEKLKGSVPNLGNLAEEGEYIKKTGQKTFTYEDVNGKIYNITLE